MTKPFCVVIDTEKQSCLGVDFFDDVEKMRRSAGMYRRDCGQDCVVIEHPSLDRQYVDAVLSSVGSERDALKTELRIAVGKARPDMKGGGPENYC